VARQLNIENTDPEQNLDHAAEKLQAIIESHLSNLSPEEQKKKWDELEDYVNGVSRDARAKR
jgi:hypothetical protein